MLCNDTACSVPYPTAVYKLASFPTPDIGVTTLGTCVDTNSCSSSSSALWAELTSACMVPPVSIGFEMRYWTNVTGCNSNVDFARTRFNQQGGIALRGCNNNGVLSIYRNGSYTVTQGVSGTFPCVHRG